MNQKTLIFVDENIAIVSVFDLQNVRNDGVGGLRFYEVLTSLLEVDVVLWSEVIDEELIKWLFIGLSNRISWNSFRHHLNDPTDVQVLPCAIGNRFVGEQLQLQIVNTKDFWKLLNYLQCKTILPNVIEDLKNAWHLNVVDGRILLVLVSCVGFPLFSFRHRHFDFVYVDLHIIDWVETFWIFGGRGRQHILRQFAQSTADYFPHIHW